MMNNINQYTIKTFKKLYPNPKSELIFENDFQLVVSVMLSAQCTDKKVNQVTPKLFAKYGSFFALSLANLSDLKKIINPINYYNTKAQNLIKMAQLVCSNFKKKLPTNFNDLISLPGVGQKTANVILIEKDIAPAFPVDTHVFRVSRRLGIASGDTPEKVENELRERFNKKYWKDLHHQLIFHGRRICKAQKPLCNECMLTNICIYYSTTKNTKDTKK